MLLGAVGYIILGVLFLLAALVKAKAPFGTLENTVSLVLAILMLTIGIIDIAGGIFAIKRIRWTFALIAAILSLNVLAIVFIAVGRKEFH